MLRLISSVFAVGFAIAAHAQTPVPSRQLAIPQSTYLEWDNLRLIVSPDSGELYIYAHLGGLDRFGSSRWFATTVDATDATAWTTNVREFLGQKLAKGDTGAVRISGVLNGAGGSRLYIGRRRERGNWSSERIIAMQRRNEREPLLFAPNERDLRRILDTLDAVAARAPQPKRVGPPLYAFERLGPVDEPVSMLKREPPMYPPGEAAARREGVVLLQFIVGVDGKAELPTVRVMHATSQAFLESAIETLQKIEFNPASRRGERVRQALVMPFSWTVK